MNSKLENLINDIKNENVELFIESIFPNCEITYIGASNVSYQNNHYDCGVLCLQRMYLFKKYKKVSLTPDDKDYRIITDTKLFRL